MNHIPIGADLSTYCCENSSNLAALLLCYWKNWIIQLKKKKKSDALDPEPRTYF